MTDETRGTLYSLLERFGVPFTVLAVVLWMLRETAISLHSTVVVPVVQSHTSFLDATSQTLEEISLTQQQQAVTMKELCDEQRELRTVLTRQLDVGGKN